MLLQVWSQWQSGSNCPSPPATSSRGSSGRNHRWHTQWSCPGCCPDLPAVRGRHYKIKNNQLLNFTAFCCFLKTSFKLSQSRMAAQNLCSRKWLCGGIWLNLWLLYVMSLSRFSSAACDMWERLYILVQSRTDHVEKPPGLTWLLSACLQNKNHLGQK